VIAELTARIRNVPDDMETRIMLAQAHRMVKEFDDAAEVLQTGMKLRPNERYNQELSSVFFFQSRVIRQSEKNSLAAQFAALRKAYLAHPTNNYVTHRFVQALTSSVEEESEFARSTLQSLVDAKAPGQTAAFLLGFDCRRRTLPTKAEEYFRGLRGAAPDATPEVMAGLAAAVLSQQLKSINPIVAHQLFESSLLVWPNHPDLLKVRAQQNLMLKDFGKALGDLNKALVQRPRDAKLHEMLAVTYEYLGQSDRAREHRERAAEVRTNVTPLMNP
jgi:tetratricopeptide (TPR) repeat protein